MLKYGHTDYSSDTSIQVNVRLISGDHIETCKYIALKSGIVKNINELVNEGSVMTGQEFREAIGGYEKITDPMTGEVTVKFNNRESFKSVKKRVKVIARATPEDKFILV